MSGIFSLQEAASLAIIGGADGPTALFLTTKLASYQLGPIEVAANSDMALVPVIIPFVVRLTIRREELLINMREQDRQFGASKILVAHRAKIAFPIVVTLICGFLVPSSTPLVRMLMFGKLVKEVGIPSVPELLAGVSKGVQTNILTIFLGLSVGGKMSTDTFLNAKRQMNDAGGMLAFCSSVAGGIWLAKMYNQPSGPSTGLETDKSPDRSYRPERGADALQGGQ